MSDYIFEYYQNNKNYKKIYTGCPIKLFLSENSGIPFIILLKFDRGYRS